MPAHTDDVLQSIVSKVKNSIVTLLFALPAFGIMTGWLFKDLSELVELNYAIALRSFSVLYFSLPLLVLALSQLTLRLNNSSDDKTRQSLILKISIIAFIVGIQLLCTLCSKVGGVLFTIGLILNSVLLLSLIILLFVHYYTRPQEKVGHSLPMIAVLCIVLMIHISLGFPWDFGTLLHWTWGIGWLAVYITFIAIIKAKSKKDSNYSIPIIESVVIGLVFLIMIVVAFPTWENAPVFWPKSMSKTSGLFSKQNAYDTVFTQYRTLHDSGDYYSWITDMYPDLSRLWMISRGEKWKQDMNIRKDQILDEMLTHACFIGGLPKKSHDDIIRNRDLRNTLQNRTQIAGDTTKIILNIVQKYCTKALKTVPEDTAIARQWKLYCECEDYCDMIKKQLQPLLDRVSTDHTNNVLTKLWKLKSGKDSLDTLLHFRDRVNNQYYTENDFALLSFYRDAAEFNHKEYEKETALKIEPLLRHIQWRGIFIFGSCLVLFILFRTEMRKSTPEDKKQDKELSEQEKIIASLRVSAEAKKEAREKLRIQEALGAKNAAKKRVDDRIGSIDASILILVLLVVPLLLPIKEESVNTKEPYWFITLPNWYLPSTVANILNSSTTFHHRDTYVQKQDLEPVMQQLQDLQANIQNVRTSTDAIQSISENVIMSKDNAVTLFDSLVAVVTLPDRFFGKAHKQDRRIIGEAVKAIIKDKNEIEEKK